MSSGRNDIRLIELKDTISQLNQTIRVQTEMIKDLRKRSKNIMHPMKRRIRSFPTCRQRSHI
jgi:hypothetical protein